MLFSLQNIPSILPINLQTLLIDDNEAARNIGIAELIKVIGGLRRTGQPHRPMMRELLKVPDGHVDLTIAWLDVSFMETIWNEVAYQSKRKKPEFFEHTPEDAVQTREGWECILWGLYAYEDERPDRNYDLEERHRFDTEMERFDGKYRPVLKTFPIDRNWRSQQCKMLTQTDRRDWWWYD